MQKIFIFLPALLLNAGCDGNSTASSSLGSASSGTQSKWQDVSNGPVQFGTLSVSIQSLKSGMRKYKNEIVRLELKIKNSSTTTPSRIYSLAMDEKVRARVLGNKAGLYDLNTELFKGLELTDGQVVYMIGTRTLTPESNPPAKSYSGTMHYSLKPGETAIITYDFECPNRNPKQLWLTIPGEHLGQTGTLFLKIPAGFIEVSS